MTTVDETPPIAKDDEPASIGAEWQGDPLSGFPAEAEVAARAARSKKRTRLIAAAGTAGVALLVAGALVVPRLGWFAKAPPAAGTLTIESSPPGVEVLEADRKRGVTPVTLSLSPGPHALVLRHDGTSRNLAVNVQSGSTVVHHVEMAELPRTGSLRVDSTPPGAAVEIDGTSRGTTPVEVSGLEPGNHDVTVGSGRAVFSQKVAIAAGAPMALMVPLGQGESSAAGWITVSSPIELQIYEGDALVGNSRMARVMLPAGSRTLRLANAETGYEATTRVQVQAGAGMQLPVKLPTGLLSVNAAPWAEVFIDGRRIGETPIANFAAQIGPHEIVMRNPRYAEQRRTVVVSLAAPVRVGVDLRQ